MKGMVRAYLREYVLSEAMENLGIPTTRALTAISTGEKVEKRVSRCNIN